MCLHSINQFSSITIFPLIFNTKISIFLPFSSEYWWIWWMYPHWRFFLRSEQANVLFSGEREHPCAWFRRERLWPGHHSHQLWLFYMEGKKSLLCPSRPVPRNDLYWFDSLQFYITKENRGNEGTCIGVSRWPVRDHNHHTTTDMWLYRAYSGNLYHGGELVRTLPSFTQGDTITCILDMEAHTISFAKNDKVWLDIQSVFVAFLKLNGVFQEFDYNFFL